MNTKLHVKTIYSCFLALALSFGCTKEDPITEKEQLDRNARIGAETQTLATGSILVKSKNYIIISSSNQLPANLKSQVASLKGNITSQMEQVGIATATSGDPDFAAKAAKISGVRSVVRDLQIQWYEPEKMKTLGLNAANVNPPSTGDSNPLFFLQWGHTAIQAPAAWNAGARGKGVKVAVLDGGFYPQHPDLAGNVIYSKSFVPEENVIMEGNGFSHGTHVAGTIAAIDNTIGVIGVAPEAKLILLKVLSDSGSGEFSWMLQGILHAVQQDADIINMSLGAYLPRNGKFVDEEGNVINATSAVQELIVAITKVTNYATQKGVTIISSAGNSAINGNNDKSGISIPSGVPNVISISATAPIGWFNNPTTTNLDRVASYTNFGTPDVTFAAPGGDFAYPGNELSPFKISVRVFDAVLSTATPDNYNWSAGTSMASPHAAGVAALIIEKNGGKMQPKQVEAALRASADDLGKPGRDPFYGYGRVNAYRAVSPLAK